MNNMLQVNRLIVIGASAGGPTALRTLVAGCLDQTLPAAVLVVQHSSPSEPRLLDRLLQNASPVPVVYAKEGDALQNGRILIAPPDHHLMVYDGQVLVTHGPRQPRTAQYRRVIPLRSRCRRFPHHRRIA